MPIQTERTPTARGEGTRARLVEAAYAQFVQRGYHGASMRQIAAGAGMAVGGIYNHFANKEELFVAVLDQYHPYHVIMPALAESQGDDMETLLRTTAERIYRAVREQTSSFMPLIYVELVEFRGRHLPQLAERIIPIIAIYVARFLERSNELRPLPVPVIQRAFMSLMAGYFFTDYVLQTSEALRPPGEVDWFGGVLDIFLHGVLRAEGQG